jgi:hypothetical protein
MSTVPLEGYEVEFIPLERRLVDRRKATANAPLPPGLKKDRRASEGRRSHDLSPAVHTNTVQ